MSPIASCETTILPFRIRDILLIGMTVAFGLVVFGVISIFQLSTETAVLRDSALAGVNGTWNKRIALHAGMLTTGLVRAGSHFLKLAPEPRAAFDSIRGAEVGIYKLQGTAGRVDHGAILARADKAMSARRWDRVVGVSGQKQLVAVYVPHQGVSQTQVKCCVMVLQDTDLVLAGVSGNLDPLLKILDKQVDLADVERHFALR